MKFQHKYALIAVLASSLATLSPLAAQAHDEVVGTSPAADSTVSAGAVTLSVTFNEDIMKSADQAGEAIELVNSLDEHLTLTAGCLHVDGATLSTQVTIPQAGDYTVNWRSVSNDGHPNEGSFHFTVDNANPDDHNVMNSAETGDCPAQYMAVDRALEPTATPVEISAQTPISPAKPDPFIANLPYLGAGLILVVLGGIAGPVIQRLRQRRAAVKAELKKLQDQD